MNDYLETSLPSNLFDKLLLSPHLKDELDSVKTLKPTPGFCLKVKDEEQNKVFINFSHSSGLPAPKDITEEELGDIISKEENEIVNYRVPISLGEARRETDKSGNPCTVYDVVINSTFFDKVMKSLLFKNFVIQVAFEGLEDKHRITLNKQDWVILKNRKYMGNLTDVTVRTKNNPLITELSSSELLNSTEKKSQPLIEEINNTVTLEPKQLPEPVYTIMQEPIKGYPTHLVAEFQLPGTINSKQIELDLGEDRIVLNVKPQKYHLDIFLPFLIDVDESGAQFNSNTEILTLTMTVQLQKQQS